MENPSTPASPAPEQQQAAPASPASVCYPFNPNYDAEAHAGAAAREDLDGAVTCPSCGRMSVTAHQP